MKTLIANRLKQLGYTYSEQTGYWHTKIGGIPYTIFAAVSLTGVEREHEDNLKHYNQFKHL